MKKQKNKITENEFNVARESFLRTSLSAEQKQSMFENILKSSSSSASSSATVSLDSAQDGTKYGAVGADENEKVGVGSGSTEQIGRMHNVKGQGDNADFKTISLGKTLGIVSFIQPHMLKQKASVIILLAILLLTGTTFASTLSLPGDLLYVVKVRIVEPIAITTKLSTQAKIQLRIELIEKRIDELKRLEDARLLNENIVKKSVYVTQENIKYLEESAKLIVDENNIKISAKIQEYNLVLEQRISNAVGLKAGLSTISDIFASSTASSTGTLNATSTNTNAERPGERSEARSGSEVGEGNSTLYQRQYVNTGELSTVNATASIPVVGGKEVKSKINSWIKSDIFKVIK